MINARLIGEMGIEIIVNNRISLKGSSISGFAVKGRFRYFLKDISGRMLTPKVLGDHGDSQVVIGNGVDDVKL